MCHNRTKNNKTNTLHERWPRLLYKENKSTLNDLLENDDYVSIHHRNLRALAVECIENKMFVTATGLEFPTISL